MWRIVLTGVGGAICLAVLVAILIPVFEAAKTNPVSESCVARMRQSCIGLMLYAADYDNRFPPARHWMDLARPNVMSDDVFRCPKLREEDPDAYGYAMVDGMSGARESDLACPAEEPLLFESVLTYRNAHGPFKGFPDPPRHGDKNRVAFGDGHVGSLGLAEAVRTGGKLKERRP